MVRILLAALLALVPLPLVAQTLHCLGRDPRFMLVIEEGDALFDYLGDATFAVAPPLAAPLGDFLRFEIATHGGPVPVFIERASCPILGTELAFRVEIGIETPRGAAPMTGCCREAR
ncbi:hypothetical protein [Roseicyclus sp.]|uniref:hypothetical protein n=1 Tax=Roseicyclus sp. TaxID=1914329 RepID=UPI003F9EF24C